MFLNICMTFKNSFIAISVPEARDREVRRVFIQRFYYDTYVLYNRKIQEKEKQNHGDVFRLQEAETIIFLIPEKCTFRVLPIRSYPSVLMCSGLLQSSRTNKNTISASHRNICLVCVEIEDQNLCRIRPPARTFSLSMVCVRRHLRGCTVVSNRREKPMPVSAVSPLLL